VPPPPAAVGNFGNFVTARLATGGALNGPADVAALQSAGITHVIDCRVEFDDGSLLAQRFQYLYDPTPDDGNPKPASWFQPGIAFGLQALSQPVNRVYVHCTAGVNRGPSMCYAIMRALGWSGPDAISTIKAARPVAQIRYSADADAAIPALGYG
jgi:dual specificity phosphatase 3